MSIKTRHGGLQSIKVRAALYYAKKRRLARLAAQKAIEEGGDPGIFSTDFSEDFE